MPSREREWRSWAAAALLLASFWLPVCQGWAGAQPTEGSPFRSLGKWVLGEEGQPLAPPQPGRRAAGLQTSGLSYDGRQLWSVGDQRSNFPASLFAIDPSTGRLRRPPIPLRVGPTTQGEIPARLREANPDLEGVAVLPGSPLHFYIVLEK